MSHKFGFVNTWMCESENLQDVCRFVVAEDKLRRPAGAQELGMGFVAVAVGIEWNDTLFFFSSCMPYDHQ